MTRTLAAALALAVAAVATMAPVAAQDFYKGQTLTIVVGFTPGGGFDLNARLLARHIGRHIAGNPDVIVQNMPGAASLKSVRGELDGDCGSWSSIPQEWVEGAKINPILRSAPLAPPDLSPDVPYAADMAPSARDRDIIRLLTASGQVGRPFMASAMVPAERIALIRAAFDETVKDPEFIADAAKLRMPVTPKSGRQALRTVEEIYATPDNIVQAARKIAGE
jgi:hypothetical protein